MAAQAGKFQGGRLGFCNGAGAQLVVLRLFNQLVAKQVQGTPNAAVQHAEPGLEARHPQRDGVGFRRPRQSVDGGRVMHSNCLRAPAISLICRAGLRSLAAEPGRAGSHVLERT